MKRVGTLHFSWRPKKNEKLRYKLQKTLDKLNPFGTVTGRAFTMPLRRSVVEKIDRAVVAMHKSKELTGNERTSVYRLLKGSDRKDVLALLTQEALLAVKSSMPKSEQDDLVAAVKIASLASLHAPANAGLSKDLSIVSGKLAVLACQFARRVDEKLALELHETLTHTESYDSPQTLLQEPVDPLRSFYWNKGRAMALVVGKWVSEHTQVDMLEEAYLDAAAHQVLYREIAAYTTRKNAKTVMETANYKNVLAASMSHYRSLQDTLEKCRMPFVPSFMTHITERHGRVYLSDMERMTPMEYVSLTISYLLVAAWAVIILFPLFQMVILSFDGTRANLLSELPGQDQGAGIHYLNLFEKTDFKY